MREESIVYFYVLKGRYARRYLWQKPLFSAEKHTKQLPGGHICFQVYRIGIPEFDRRNRPWNIYKLTGKIIGLLEGEDISRDAYYWAEEGVRKLVDIPREPLPERMREEILRCIGEYDAVIIIDGPWADVKEVVELHCAKLRFLAVVSERPAHFEELLEDVYEEYGLLSQNVESMEQVYGKEGLQYLVIDCSEQGRMPYRKLPRDSQYLDLQSNPAKQRILRAKRKDVKYVSFFQLFLASYSPIS